MPFVHLPEQQLNVFYVLNACEPIPYPTSHLSSDFQESGVYDPSKPTLLLLHAGCRTVAAFSAQFSDARLKSQFNLLSIAPKYHGRTEFYGVQKMEHTLLNAAEGIMATMDILTNRFGITEYGVFGEGIAGCYIATLLAQNKPNFVTRLLLSSPGRLVESQAISTALKDLLPLICANKDGKGDGTGTIAEEVLRENGNYAFGGLDRQVERQREHNDSFQMRYGTGHSSHDITQCFLSEAHRQPLSLSLLANIHIPVLILQGERDVAVSPEWAAEEWKNGFTNATGAAEIRIIIGGPHLLSFVEIGIVNRIIAAFLNRTFPVPPPPTTA